MPGQSEQSPVMEAPDIDLSKSSYLDFKTYLFTTTSTTPSPDPYAASDPVQLVLWYQGADISGSPFYSVDARSSAADQLAARTKLQASQTFGAHAPEGEAKLKHFVAPPYSDRATFELKHHQATNRPAILTIQSVRESDAGLYWCRVDYRWTRTTISKVRLNVLGKLGNFGSVFH